jgi:sialate O-acetylesterase
VKLSILAAFAALAANAAVRLPHLLTSGMVVQRGMPVHVWGAADPGEPVNVAFRGETRATTADELGRWSVWLKPGDAGGPFELKINAVTLTDILVGDLWVAAGQSNMEWPVRWSADPDKERAAADYPRIRLARTMHRVSGHPLENWTGEQWRPCNSTSVEHFSAVGYHFARIQHEKLRIPIGVIQAAWGGTPAEAWTSLEGLSSDPGLMAVFSEWSRLTAQHETELLRFPRRMAEWKKAGSKGDPPEMRRRPGGQWTPAALFNAMIAPLTKLPIRGVIWYQGEANTAAERAPLYERLLPVLIRDWRRAWGQGDFPFLIVQLANYEATPDSMWPEVRDAQRRTLNVANTAMAVTIDIGEAKDIHPRNKREVGRRLALAFDGVTGPLLLQAHRDGEGVRLWFSHVHGGLVARGALRGFELAGEDGRFTPAEARIHGDTVLVTGAIVDPREVRYAWSPNPKASLFNAEGLPASPFRSGVSP